MPEQITVRALTEDDWQMFEKLRLAALKECPNVFLSPYAAERDNTPDVWKSWLKQDGKCVFALFNEAEFIGFQGVATYWYDKAVGIIWGSYIKPEHRKRGLSGRLYRACLDYAKGFLPWKKLIVSHREGNEASRRSILEFDFKFTHRDTKNWHDGVVCDELHYALDLEKLRRSQA